MSQATDKTVLFADLRGSTGLFEDLGNRAATRWVSRCVTDIAQGVVEDGGIVVKTLGDGLLAFFPTPSTAVRAAFRMQEVLDRTLQGDVGAPGRSSAETLQLQIAISFGEVIELGGDAYGDAINIAARLLDHANDRETLITGPAHERLDPTRRTIFRRLGPLSLRGRAEPVEVLVAGGRRSGEDATTQSEVMSAEPAPASLRLSSVQVDKWIERTQLPLLIGRGPRAGYRIEHPKVSRVHARIEWQGEAFVLCDLSFNGTHVRFSDGDGIQLRRTVCVLHGRGQIFLGPLPDSGRPALEIRFQVHYPRETLAAPL